MSTRANTSVQTINGMAVAGLGCGLFGIFVAGLLGFAFPPFAVMAALIGIVAVGLSRKGLAFARTFNRRNRLAVAGAVSGTVATLLGVVGVAIA
jgi:hypothetical protein